MGLPAGWCASLLRRLALGSLSGASTALALACLPGCASQPPAAAPAAQASSTTDALGRVPDDLTVDITVLSGAELRTRSEAHVARSKYIVFPDGSLHGDRGRSIEVLTRPTRVRTLSRETMSDLWFLLEAAGFTQLAETGFSGNPALLAPSPAEVLTILSVRANGMSGTFIRRTPADATDPAMTRVVRAVARLAWATDDPPLEATVQPIRYDLGPDPYARYRTPSSR